MSDTATTTSTTVDTTIKIKTPSMWKVTVLNDEKTEMHFVVSVLKEIFGKSIEEAWRLTLLIDNSGSATVGLFTKEIALTKVRQTHIAAESYGYPLQAVAEEA